MGKKVSSLERGKKRSNKNKLQERSRGMILPHLPHGNIKPIISQARNDQTKCPPLVVGRQVVREVGSERGRKTERDGAKKGGEEKRDGERERGRRTYGTKGKER
ncbi:hypothetical protein KM043_018207 [Ampulex compressa]|nr:hypothetical protein KM043_018207 [Ampulex compressa]